MLVGVLCIVSTTSVIYAADEKSNSLFKAASDGGEPFDDTFDNDLDLFEDDADLKRVEISDPLEPVNRAIFAFNDKVYFWVVKPVATGYEAVVPAPAGIGS